MFAFVKRGIQGGTGQRIQQRRKRIQQMMRKIKEGDTVQVTHEDNTLVGEVVEIKERKLMISGYIHWFPEWECKIVRFGS